MEPVTDRMRKGGHVLYHLTSEGEYKLIQTKEKPPGAITRSPNAMTFLDTSIGKYAIETRKFYKSLRARDVIEKPLTRTESHSIAGPYVFKSRIEPFDCVIEEMIADVIDAVCEDDQKTAFAECLCEEYDSSNEDAFDGFPADELHQERLVEKSRAAVQDLIIKFPVVFHVAHDSLFPVRCFYVANGLRQFPDVEYTRPIHCAIYDKKSKNMAVKIARKFLTTPLPEGVVECAPLDHTTECLVLFVMLVDRHGLY